jgi:hypothetical protein
VERSGVAGRRGRRKLALHWRSCTQGRHGGLGGDVGWSEGGTPLSRESDGLLCPSITLNRPCRCEGRQSAASEAMVLAAVPQSFAAAGGRAFYQTCFSASSILIPDNT